MCDFDITLYSVYLVLLVPWILHGTFDFVLFVGGSSHKDIGILGFAASIILMLLGLFYVRREAMLMELETRNRGMADRIVIRDKIVYSDLETGEV